jgi:DNA-binding SARP family transcriptional activator
MSTDSAVVDSAFPGPNGRLVRGRLLALRAWLRHIEGDVTQADVDLMAAWAEAAEALPHVLRSGWEGFDSVVWTALERGVLEPEPATDETATTFSEGLQIISFLDHPTPAVRKAAHRLATSSSPFRFEVLGGFAVRRGSWRAAGADWTRPMAARLVRFLLVNAGKPVPEDLIFETMWPGRSLPSARRNLQVTASRARQVLDPPGAKRSVIEAGDHCYRLALGDRDVVDADEFQAAARAALAESGEGKRTLLERARSLWGGEPLPEERYSGWATAYRERLTDRYIAVLTALVELHERAGENAGAAAIARELVDIDPLNEGAHRALIAAYARAGRTGQALRQFLECRRALIEELGVEPAAETSRLQARILAGEAV